METLQLAQMLADLSSLNADPNSSDSLFRPSKTALSISNATPEPNASTPTPLNPSTSLPRSSSFSPTPLRARAPSVPPPGSGTPSAGLAAARSTGVSTPFDAYVGRHLLSTPASGTSSVPGTPRGETDADVDRASTLMALYELRAKLKQYNDSNSLLQARERIAALRARQTPQTPQNASQTQNGPAPSLAAQPMRHSTQYTYPHSAK